MTARWYTYDDDNQLDISTAEHFSVTLVLYSDIRGGYPQTLMPKHYQTIDQVIEHLRNETDRTVEEIVIKRVNRGGI